MERGGFIMIGYTAVKQDGETQFQADVRVSSAAMLVSQRVGQVLGKSCVIASMSGLSPDLPRFEIFLGRSLQSDERFGDDRDHGD